MKILKSIILILVFLIPFWLGFIYGKNIPIMEQNKIVDILITFSSIIFAVMGAWIAIVYPDALKNKEIRKNKNLTIILKPLVLSTFILACCLLSKYFYPVLIQINFLIGIKHQLRSLYYAFIGILIITMIYNLLLTLIPVDMKKREIDSKINSENRISRLSKVTKKNKNHE